MPPSRVGRPRYAELYREVPSAASAAAPEPAAGSSRPERRGRRLPFGLRLTERSETRIRFRCLVLSGLFVPVFLWHFVVVGDSWAPARLPGDAPEPPPAAELLAGEESLPPFTSPRRLDGPGFVPGMMHGYDCLTLSEQYDRQEIRFLMVRKSHITMGGSDKQGCLSKDGPCLKKGNEWLLILYIPAMFYMFVALAIICDEFFVPSLEMFVDHYEIPMDIAGATFMAAGGSMPELFTSLISVFDESDVGFAAIVGSAVFNVLFVIAVCTLASQEPLALTAWPLARDCAFYIVGLGLVVAFFQGSSPKEIEWWEAFLLFCWYNCYVGFMTINGKAKKFFDDWFSKYSRKAVAPECDDPRAADGTAPRPSGHSDVSLKMPSKFRSGIVKLLTQHASLTETAGIAVILEMKGSLQQAFAEMDQDKDGKINEAEFNMFMQKLGWTPPSDDEIRNIKASGGAQEDAASRLWKRMPLTSEDKLAFEDFRKWYTVSEARIAVEVRKVFERLDRNGDGILDKDEIAQLLLLLGHRPTNAELEEVVAEITRMSVKDDPEAAEVLSDSDAPEAVARKGSVHFEHFEKWYSQSMFCEQHKKNHQMEVIEEAGFSIDWPEEGATWMQWFWYFFTYPLCAAMYCTLPDVRRPGMEGKVRWAILEFALSLVWIAVFSNALYECTVVCSNTMGIPAPVAGVTIVAAGTSVPDLLSSYIVARQGEGDMAVSSSIGSNIFDITVGLPVPWMLYSISKGGKPVKVNTKSLGASVIILMCMLIAVITTVMIMKWRMNRPLGAVMIVLYFVFITLDLLQNLPQSNPVIDFGF